MNAPGWYGKIPALGDFASRRLASAFVAPWDDWLQDSMSQSRQALGAQWLDIYLTSPVWRFVLLPGVINAQAWAGVLMPSVDKVGRHFPLTLALGLDMQPSPVSALFQAQAWFDALEAEALAALAPQSTAETLEKKLQGLPWQIPPLASDAVSPAGAAVAEWLRSASEQPLRRPLPSLHSLTDTMARAQQSLVGSLGYGRSFWWTGMDGGEAGAELLCFKGLPSAYNFKMLLQP